MKTKRQTDWQFYWRNLKHLFPKLTKIIVRKQVEGYLFLCSIIFLCTYLFLYRTEKQSFYHTPGENLQMHLSIEHVIMKAYQINRERTQY